MSRSVKIGLGILGVVVLAICLIAVGLSGGGEEATKVGEVASATAAEEKQVAEATATEEPEVEKPTEAETPTAEGPTKYGVGDIVSIGDIAMVVLGWDSPEGGEINKPEEGKKFVVVDLILVNEGESSTSVSSLLQMSLKDETGQRYSVDPMAVSAAGGSSPEGEIAPGERVRGQVGFQASKDAKSLVLIYDASVFGTGKVFVKLGSEPLAVEPPAQIAGEREQKMFAVGDVIEAGDLTLTVNEVTSPSGGEFNQPEEGKRFLVVDLTLENQGDEAENVSSLMQMSLKDSTGQKYDVDPMAVTAAGGTTPEGEISPGEKLRGQVGFQVPQDARGLVFVFDASVFGHGKVFVSLSEK